MTGLTATVTGALAIAAVSTVGDVIWATWIPRHRMVFGLAHGTLLFLAIGLVLGVAARRPLAGTLWGGLVGFAAAGSFYVLAPFLGYSSMFASWFLMWIALAAVYASLARTSTGRGPLVARGLAGATASGLAFYLVSGIWRPFDPAGWDYAWHFAAWTFAYFPGFAALLVGHPMHGAASPLES